MFGSLLGVLSLGQASIRNPESYPHTSTAARTSFSNGSAGLRTSGEEQRPQLFKDDTQVHRLRFNAHRCRVSVARTGKRTHTALPSF